MSDNLESEVLAEIDEALSFVSIDQQVIRALHLARERVCRLSDTCDTLRAQLSEARARLASGDRYCCMCGHAICEHCKADDAPVSPAAEVAQGVADDVVRDAPKGFVLMELGIRPQYQIDAAMRDLRLMRQIGANEDACVTAAIEAALLAAAQQQKEGGE